MEANNTDWFDILFRTAFSQNHSLSMSGGNKLATYRTSLGFSQNNNTAKGNNKTQYTFSTNVSFRLWEKVTLNTMIAASVSKTKAFLGLDPYSFATSTNRALPAYNEDGTRYFYAHERNGYLYNAENELENSGNENKMTTLNTSFNLRWNIFRYLTLNTMFGFSASHTNGESWYTERSNYIAEIRRYDYDAYEEGSPEYEDSVLPMGGELNEMRNNNQSWSLRNQLEFNKVFNEVHSVTAMVGQELRSSSTDGTKRRTYGYLPDRGKIVVNVPDIVNDKINPYLRSTPSIIDTKSNNVSFYTTLSYMYDNRYAINASVRMDASNRFGQDKSTRFLPIYALGARWNVGSEHWLEGQDILSDMSLRFSFGYQGNAVESVSPYLIATITTTNTGYNLQLKDLPAPDLKWEKVSNMSIGIDWSLFSNKINGTFEWYQKKTTDMVTNLDVPYENGVLSRSVNGGSMKNSGWDLSASFVPVKGKDWFLSCGVNIGQVDNKVNSMIEPNGSWQQLTSGNVSQKGYPVSSFWAFRYTGLNPEHGGPEFDLSGCEGSYKEDATLYMKHVGKIDPDFNAGINLTLRYKTFSLSTGLYLSTGNQTFLASPTAGMVQNIPSEYRNMSTEWLKRWRKPGDELHTNVPALPNMANNAQPIKISTVGTTVNFYPYEMYGYSDIRVVDAWYLRCGNINMSYTFPAKFLPKAIRNLSLNASITNPFVIHSSDFKGRDPEVALGQQPLQHTVTFGLNMSF